MSAKGSACMFCWDCFACLALFLVFFALAMALAVILKPPDRSIAWQARQTEETRAAREEIERTTPIVCLLCANTYSVKNNSSQKSLKGLQICLNSFKIRLQVIQLEFSRDTASIPLDNCIGLTSITNSFDIRSILFESSKPL